MLWFCFSCFIGLFHHGIGGIVKSDLTPNRPHMVVQGVGAHKITQGSNHTEKGLHPSTRSKN